MFVLTANLPSGESEKRTITPDRRAIPTCAWCVNPWNPPTEIRSALRGLRGSRGQDLPRADAAYRKGRRSIFVISGNLFTRDYLLEGIARTGQWKSLTDKNFQMLKQRLEALARNFLKIAKPNEAETEK